MDLLARPDQANDNAPLGNPLGECDEVLRLGFPVAATSMYLSDLGRVEGSLSLVKDQHVFRGNEIGLPRIPLHVRLDRPDECSAPSAGGSELVLENLDERPISG